MKSQDNSQLQVRGLPKRLMNRTWEECRFQGGKELKLQLKDTTITTEIPTAEIQYHPS